MPLEKTEENLKTCQICKKIFKSKLGVALHIRQTHKIIKKDYYDQFYKTENEGICRNCVKNTTIFNFNYQKYCSVKCRNTDPKMIKQQKKNNLIKYGVENTMQVKNIQLKAETTNLLRYGVKNVGLLKEMQEKVEQTNFLKYGCRRPLQNKRIHNKVEQTCLERYGVNNIGSLASVVEKRKNTMLLRYGVENCQQNKEISEKTCKSSKQGHPYTLPSGKIVYKMGYEPQFLDYVFKNNILKEDEIVYHPKGIKYKTEDCKQHYYFPDFYIPKWNLIIEIKSIFTLTKDQNVYLKEAETIKQGFKYIRIINIDPKTLDFKKFNQFNNLV